MNTIKSRFCPSPTGLMTVGNLRTALFSYLLAGTQNIFLLRIEDTDRARSSQEFSHQLMADLKWLNINWNEGAYYQSERGEIYERYYQQLLDQKKAYYCFCTDMELQLARRQLMQTGQAPRYLGTCRHLTPEQVQQKLSKGLKPAIRYRIGENQEIAFNDLVQGPKSFQADDIGDFIIKKNDDSASFMFCNALDDSLMGVTHVMRGEDHLTNTPRQLLILQSLGLRAPLYGHMALIVGHDGKPLSKRNGSLSVVELRDQGFLPIAVVNYLSRVGHHFDLAHCPQAEHLLSLPELSEHFRLEQVSRSPARFDNQQLLHWQVEAISRMTDEEITDWLLICLNKTPNNKIHDNQIPRFVKTIRGNITNYKDVHFWIHQFFSDQLDYTLEKSYTADLKQAGVNYFEAAKTAIEAQATDHIDKTLFFNDLKAKLTLKGPALFMPMRIAITGVNYGPEMDKIFALLSKEKLIDRLDQVLEFLGKN